MIEAGRHVGNFVVEHARRIGDDDSKPRRRLGIDIVVAVAEIGFAPPIPAFAFTCLLSLGMSPWIREIKFPVGPLFFLGLGLVAAPLLVFLWQSHSSVDPSSSQEPEFNPAAPVSDPVCAAFAEPSPPKVAQVRDNNPGSQGFQRCLLA